jgi:integrative and conjugative element protein (TIGR02256 family)
MFFDEDIVFFRLNQGCFKISCEVVKVLKRYCQESINTPEAGGILLGRYILASEDVVVDSISTPMYGDRQTRFSFFRNAKQHQQVIEEMWYESNGTTNYLGEWHTHPELLPKPSGVDVRDWKRKLKQDRFHGDCLFFVIIGIHQIDAWEGCQSNYHINKLKRRY